MNIGKKIIDMDRVVGLLEKNDPVSLSGFEDDNGKPLLLMLYILPEYEQEVRGFAQSILDRHKVQLNNAVIAPK